MSAWGHLSPPAGATRQVRRRRPSADVAVRLTEHQPFSALQVRWIESGRDLVPGQVACAAVFRTAEWPDADPRAGRAGGAIEAHDARRPTPRAMSRIPVPGPTGSAKVLMFMFCAGRQHHNLWYVGGKRAQYLVVFHSLFHPQLWISRGAHGSFGKSLGF